MAAMRMEINKYSWYLTGIVIFGLFMATLHPTITAGDSGEIDAAVFSLGIPHPPGYPFYVSIAKSFTHALPLGSMAYRVNIASAMFGAASCWMVYLITLKIAGAGLAPAKEGQPQELPLRLSAFFAAASLALSHEFWYRSTVAEVYTLNAFLVLMIIYVLLVWRERGLSPHGDKSLFTDEAERSRRIGTVPGIAHRFTNSRLLYFAAFLFGLGIGNHHTIALIVPGIVAFIWMAKGKGQSAESNASYAMRHALCAMLFFLLGFSIYLYLPVRSFKDPFMDWGDPQNLLNFIDVFARRSYLPQEMERGWEMFVKQIRTFNPIHEFTFIGALLGLLGMWGLWRADRAMAAMLLMAFTLTSYGLILLAGSSTKDVDVLKKFYLPAYAVFSIMIGVGTATGMAHGAGRIASYALRPLLYALCGVFLIWQFSTHLPRTANAANYLAYDYGMNELNSLRYGATYISKGEIKTFPLRYLQGMERYREDVNVVTAYFLTRRWYLREALRIAGAPRAIPQGLTYKQMLVVSIYRVNADKGVYTGFLDEEYIPKDLSTYTQGITFQLYKKPEERFKGDVWPMYRLRGVERVEEWMDRGIVEILKDYASSHYNTGLEYYDEGDADRAITEFEKALAINPGDPDSLNNLAALYAKKGIKLKEAEGLAKKAFGLYTGEKDKDMAKGTIEEIEKKMKGSI